MGRPRKAPGDRARKVSISLRDEVLYALEQEAQAGRRSLSSTIELYLTSDVGITPVVRPGWEVGPEEAVAKGQIAPGVTREGFRGPELAPPPTPLARTKASPDRQKPARTGLCSHRIPATSFCRVCDK